MIKVVLYQDGEIIQELEGMFAWGSVVMDEDEGQSCAFAAGKVDARIIPLKMANACAELMLSTYGIKRGTPAVFLLKKLFEVAVEEAFEKEPDDEEKVSAVVKKVEGDE